MVVPITDMASECLFSFGAIIATMHSPAWGFVLIGAIRAHNDTQPSKLVFTALNALLILSSYGTRSRRNSHTYLTNYSKVPLC